MNRLTYTQNRELSWLKFNERVLEEVDDPKVPLLEKLKFIAIFTSNLDEFFMIRVGSLFDLSLANETAIDKKTGMTPKEQLEKIYKAVIPLYEKRDKALEQVAKELRHYGIYSLEMNELEANEKVYIDTYFKENILPILSPQIVDARHPFPHIANKVIHIVTLLKHKKGNLLGLVPIPSSLPEIVYLPGSDIRFINIEKIIYAYVTSIFEMYEVMEKNYLCVTRNADISPDDENFDINEDFRYEMKRLLVKRRRLSVVRLEVSKPMSKEFEAYFCEKLDITKNQIFVSRKPMKMGYAFSLASKLNLPKKRALLDPEFVPQPSRSIDLEQSIIKQIYKKDLLLSYPYESMTPFLNLMKEAIIDPAVISIKITIYRVAQKAKLIEYLCAAAENGKDVTVLIELRARFDELNNIDWSERLEEAGCKVIYGFEGFKVHSKICLITRKEKGEIKPITYIGTGNFNEKTAKMYTDLALITADPYIGQDATNFFKNMAISNLEGVYHELMVAPNSLKDRMIACIDEEIQKGEEGYIFFKVNSVTDLDLIKKLSEASCAGVKVELIVRGICCILPQIPGATENIKISSIVGRFLEHSRVYIFGKGLQQKMYISSADLMTRNTQNRVEIACPIKDQEIKSRINKIIETMCHDTEKARLLGSDGIYYKKSADLNPINSQEIFIKEALEKAEIKLQKSKLEINGLVKFFMKFVKKGA